MQILGHTTGSIQALVARLQDCDVRLRWGGPQVTNAINGDVHLLDGLEQLQKLKQAGVSTPFFMVPQETEDGPFEGAIWLARKRNHTQGRDILQVGTRRQNGRRSWQNSDFFVKYQPAVREWRFHILNGISIARGLKEFTGAIQNFDAPPVTTTHPIIRSRRLGWHMRHDIDPPKGLRTLAKAAVAAVGYQLGAVDMLELANGTGVVLEVNSRPAIRDDYTLAAYEKALRAL